MFKCKLKDILYIILVIYNIYTLNHFFFSLVFVYTSKKTGPQGAVSIRKTVLPGMAIPMLKIRRPNGRLIFNMEIAIRR